MSTKFCSYCRTEMDSIATVCRGCGAVEVEEIDNSTLGMVRGVFGAVVVGLIVGYFSVLWGLIIFAVCTGCVWFAGGITTTRWERK
jgi:hypothetical protein